MLDVAVLAISSLALFCQISLDHPKAGAKPPSPKGLSLQGQAAVPAWAEDKSQGVGDRAASSPLQQCSGAGVRTSSPAGVDSGLQAEGRRRAGRGGVFQTPTG